MASPGALEPGALEPEALAPEALAPEALAPEALAPDALAPDALAPDALAPEALAHTSLSCQELLAFDEDQLVRFLNDCRTPNNDFDISRVADLDGLSEAQRGDFSQKLSAAVEKAGPFDSDALSRILGMLASKIKTSDTPEGSQSREIRSPTSSPIPTDYSRFEAFCHDELIKAGGRPAVTSDFFFGTFTDAEASSEILTQWLDDPDSGFRDGHVPPLFSTQLEDWESFQHKWQWDNRGKYASSEGFTSFLESQRKRWLHKGESKLVSDPSFEATTRKIWEYEQRPLELSGREGFAAYAQAVERRLASHHFTQPVQLAEDPRKQDAWTTWVEYLCYVYWWLDWHVAAMETAEPKYRKAWDELQRFEKSPFSTTTTTTSVPDEELGTIKAQLEATRQQIHKFIKDTKMYRRCERAVRRHELRAQWVLEQVSLIESAAIAGNKPPEDHANGNNSRKRKARDDPEASTCQQPKRKQQASHGDSAPSSGSGTGKGYVATTRVETAATSTTVGSENLVEASAAVLES